MKHRQRWVGTICCSVLSIMACLFLATHMKGAFRAAGHPEIDLLFFILPGTVASFSLQRRGILKPLFDAALTAPYLVPIMRLFLSPTHSFWQELAWLLSAVSWRALGVLCLLLISNLFKPQYRGNQQNPQHEGLPDGQASGSSFTHAAESV